jgi:hypothetical protein
VEEVEGIQVERWMGFGGRGAMVSLHEHRAGCGDNGTFVFRLGEPDQSESEGEKSERECGGGGVRSVFISVPGLATWRQ